MLLASRWGGKMRLLLWQHHSCKNMQTLRHFQQLDMNWSSASPLSHPMKRLWTTVSWSVWLWVTQPMEMSIIRGHVYFEQQHQQYFLIHPSSAPSALSSLSSCWASSQGPTQAPTTAHITATNPTCLLPCKCRGHLLQLLYDYLIAKFTSTKIPPIQFLCWPLCEGLVSQLIER